MRRENSEILCCYLVLFNATIAVAQEKQRVKEERENLRKQIEAEKERRKQEAKMEKERAKAEVRGVQLLSSEFFVGRRSKGSCDRDETCGEGGSIEKEDANTATGDANARASGADCACFVSAADANAGAECVVCQTSGTLTISTTGTYA